MSVLRFVLSHRILFEECDKVSFSIQEKNYERAIECYTKAILLCPGKNEEELATFYQNRAAANEMLANMKNVIADCTAAISHNKRYLKALLRRAKAYEKEGVLSKALADITAVCIMEQFENETTLMMTDRILREQSKANAKEYVKKREPKLPSSQFIKHYFMSFVQDPFFKGAGPVDEDMLMTLLNNLSLNNPNVDDDPEVNLVKGTIQILKGDIASAEDFLQKVLSLTDPPLTDQKLINLRVNALIKLGSVKVQDVEMNNMENALSCFDQAISLDLNNPDIYIHRAQLYMMIDRTDDSRADLEKCVILSPDFASAVAQKLYIEFRIAFKTASQQSVDSALRGFHAAVERFPDSSEVYSLYAQSMMDKGDYEEADKFFLKAIESDPLDANLYVHRGILKMQQFNDSEQAIRELDKACSIDPKCQFAWEMLGSLEVQRGNLVRGIKCFDNALSAATTELDCAHLFSLRDAAEAQLRAAETLGVALPPES